MLNDYGYLIKLLSVSWSSASLDYSRKQKAAPIELVLVLAKKSPKSKRGSSTGLSASAAGAIAVILGLSISMGWISMPSEASDIEVLGVALLASGMRWFVSAAVFALIAETPNEQPSTQSETCHQGVRVGRKTFAVNAASNVARTAYVTASNTVVGLMLLLIGGVAAALQSIPPHIMIAAFSVLCLIGCLLVHGLPEVQALASDHKSDD